MGSAVSDENSGAFSGAFFSYGFRPFFLLGASYGIFNLLIWGGFYAGHITPPLFMIDPVSWHAHEMIFGYLGAVLTGFLLTAVPNWTGRLPINGLGLFGLVFIWLAGRASFWLFDSSSILKPASLFSISPLAALLTPKIKK